MVRTVGLARAICNKRTRRTPCGVWSPYLAKPSVLNNTLHVRFYECIIHTCVCPLYTQTVVSGTSNPPEFNTFSVHIGQHPRLLSNTHQPLHRSTSSLPPGTDNCTRAGIYRIRDSTFHVLDIWARTVGWVRDTNESSWTEVMRTLNYKSRKLYG
jgi:hypothetical protein